MLKSGSAKRNVWRPVASEPTHNPFPQYPKKEKILPLLVAELATGWSANNRVIQSSRRKAPATASWSIIIPLLHALLHCAVLNYVALYFLNVYSF